MASAPLELSHVTKRFGAFTAVRDLSLTVPQGSIVGFLGPNGAGKSTSLRMALGVLGPDEGQVNLFGAPPNIDTLRHVGFLPEERGLYKKMSPRAIISYFARLKGMSAGESRKRADELLERMGLSEFARVRVSKLSKGMSQKVQILASLAHQPDFLILDEPFSGLDPVNQQGLEDMIIEEHKRGATILFSTHVMEHVANPHTFLVDCARLVKPGGLMICATINRTSKAFALAIVGAEWVMGWLPRGTHEFSKFLTPAEITAPLQVAGLETEPPQGVSYNPLADSWRLSGDTQVNYMIVARRPAAPGGG